MKLQIFLLVASVTGCATVPAVRPEPKAPVPLLQDGVTVEAARGIWRSRGYGLVLSVTVDGVKLHHETKAGCYPDPGGDTSPLQNLAYVVPGSTPDTLTVTSWPGETLYLFQRLQALPESCAAKTEWTPPRLFEVFAATFEESYAFFQERGVDWRARVAALRPRVTETTEPRALFQVFKELTTGLEDAHTQIEAEVDGETLSYGEGDKPTLQRVKAEGPKTGVTEREAQRAWLGAYRDGILQTVLKGTGHHVANKRILHGRIGDVGYLNVLTLGGYAGDDEPPLDEELRALGVALDEALTSFQGARAVIVDVSNNRGGHDRVARELASRFTDGRHLAYAKRPFQADVPPQAFHVEPATGPRFTGPVYLLTSDITVSAGEIFTLSMRALPNVTHVGTATRGALSDVLVKPLPNGWRVELSNELYFDPEGKQFEARGIPPELPLDVFPEADLRGGHARAVLSLVELARQRAR
ncbi:S41 family peptidase [Pyxidicoccus xibeiensis]|uniref:S41 family peptidase n=1 Tax=Pyxidicoccus xibeiensis TaxID=2906759 RepID=UPI0020A7C007|nr:S41 family peptidase [Pyxidicoccus xibeiensis]MCP3143198.1 S41 family peptidase [Pyxidicoccus xibeiensis]